MAPATGNKFDAPWEQLYYIEESNCDNVGTFRRPPEYCESIAPRRYPPALGTKLFEQIWHASPFPGLNLPTAREMAVKTL